MTNTGLSRRAHRDPAPGGGEHLKSRDQDDAVPGSPWLLPSDIGHVEEGSLEEAIWSELGALPRSRR